MGNGIRPPPPFRTLFKSVKVLVQSSPVANAASLLKDFGNSDKETISACCKDLSSFSKAICVLVGFFSSLCLSSSKVYSDYFAFRKGLLIEVREECLTKVNKSIVTPIMYLWHLLHYQQ